MTGNWGSMKLKAFVSVVIIALVGWGVAHTGLQNKANNESRAALREVVDGVQDDIPAMKDTTMYGQFVDVDIIYEGDRRIVYTYTYTHAADTTSPAAEVDRVCSSNEAQASAILAGMEREGITDPELRIEYRHPGGALDFSCDYPDR